MLHGWIANRWRRAGAALALAAAAGGAQAALPPDLGMRLADGYARPAFGRLAQATQSLGEGLGKWCARPDAAGAEQVRTRFAHVARAWAGVEFLRFGPLVQGNRYERLAFWPDTRNVMARQVQAALAAADPALLAPGALAGRSVALQGLPALEFVLYGEAGLLQQPEAPGFAYGCDLAQAMARNAAGLAGELAQAWSAQGEFGRQFTHPAPANDLYRSPQEVAAEAIKALSTGLQFARDVKLLPVLGDSAAAARPRRAAFWRSGQTAATLAAGLRGMRAFYEAGGYPLGDAGWIDATIRSELDQAAGAAARAEGPTGLLSEDGEPRDALALAALVIRNAKDVVDQHLAPAVGVTIGFNALDGD